MNARGVPGPRRESGPPDPRGRGRATGPGDPLPRRRPTDPRAFDYFDTGADQPRPQPNRPLPPQGQPPHARPSDQDRPEHDAWERDASGPSDQNPPRRARAARSARPPKPGDGTDRAGRSDRSDGADRAGRSDRADRAGRSDRAGRAGYTENIARAEPIRRAAPPAPPRAHRGPRTRTPRNHWILMAVMMIVLASMLLVGGVLNHQVGAEGSGGPHATLGSTGVPDSVSQGGPVIDTRAGAQRSLSVQPGKVALTFDDGPDPTWTPQILAVLARHHVPATFFLIGAHVAEHPGLVRDEVAAGDEVGIHTFTHSDLATAPTWRRALEFSQTQAAIAGAAGVSTPLLRPPYSSEPDALDKLDWSAVQDAGRQGYLVVLTNRDSEDWRRDGVPSILANSIPPAPAATGKAGSTQPEPGFVLMMHDAGGDRSQTVAALDQLIPLLQARGFTFTTVSGAIGAPTPIAPASPAARWQGRALIAAVVVSDTVVNWLSAAVLIAGIIAGFRIVVLLFAARRHVGRRGRPWGPPVTRPVSVIVPAYNEEAGIRATVESLSRSRHPIEIIVVDDGSTDRTGEIVQELIDRRGPHQPPLRLIQQVNGGKPAALNTGASRARADILVMMDGDTVFEPDTIRHLVQPFADPTVGAVSGNAKVGNRTGILGRWQHIEYVVGFNLERRMYDLAGCMPTVPGAVGAFRREALAGVGGISQDTLAEDTDLTMSVIRDGWRVVYEERAIAWTEVPTTLRQFWRQRYRWCYGTLQAMWKHRATVFRPGAEGRLGRRGLTYMFIFQVLLPLLAPVVDVFAIYGLVFNDATRVGEVWLAFLLAQMLMALYAFRLDKERPTALWTMPLQQVVYRQLMYLVVIHSLVTALVGSRLKWQRMQRHGSLEAPLRVGSL